MEPPKVILEAHVELRVPMFVWVAVAAFCFALAGSAITVANRIDPPPSRAQP